MARTFDATSTQAIIGKKEDAPRARSCTEAGVIVMVRETSSAEQLPGYAASPVRPTCSSKNFLFI